MRLVTRGIAACALSVPLLVGAASMASAWTYYPVNPNDQAAAAGPLGAAEFSRGDASCGAAKFHASGIFASPWGAGIFNDSSAAGSWNWRCLHPEHHHDWWDGDDR